VAVAQSLLPRSVEPDQLVLTASTSDAYGLIFKLLADPGDNVLVPQPSYPLFESLTRLDGVRAAPYQLEWHGQWSIDRDSLTAAVTSSTRAVLVVSPNNPTGSMLRLADRDWLVDLAGRRALALIADEVFADYRLAPRPDATSLLGEDRALTFVLGGLSKSAGLPQMKLAWIAVSGPAPTTGDALTRLAVIADTYLSVATPVQLAASDLIEAGRGIRRAIQARLDENLATLVRTLRPWPSLALLAPEGGWSAVVRVPAILPEEALVLRLIEQAAVRVHPGYFFDFPSEAFVVLSLLPPPDVFGEGLRRAVPILAGEGS
jgi:aspartate/methionine/tyrosine aminotransferase